MFITAVTEISLTMGFMNDCGEAVDVKSHPEKRKIDILSKLAALDYVIRKNQRDFV